MDTIAHADTFFFISSIGFVILWIMVGVFLFYLIRATRIFYRIVDKVEDDIDKLGDTTKEMLEDMRDSAVFRFIFKKKKKSKRN